MKRIAILGSTGSIGTQTLEVVENNQDIQVTALAAGSNIRLLEEQIRKFHPTLACVWDEKKAAELRTNIADLSVKVVSGMDGLLEVAVQPEAEILVTAIVGMIGIRPTIAAMKAGKDIALANKETLVTAGHIIMPLAKEVGVKILPVDSEHSAIFQSLNGEDKKAIDKILLTASGGPFRGCAAGGCVKASELDDGTQAHHRFLHHGQQGTGGHGSPLVLRCGNGSGTGCGTAAECHPFHGAVCGRRSHCAARHSGYEAADPVCALLPGTKIFAGRASGFCETGKHYL